MKRREYDDDDGRVIAPMDIDGMPWSKPRMRPIFKREKSDGGKNNASEIEPVTKKEASVMMLNALAAGLLVALIFGVAAFLFIEFCLHIWLR